MFPKASNGTLPPLIDDSRAFRGKNLLKFKLPNNPKMDLRLMHVLPSPSHQKETFIDQKVLRKFELTIKKIKELKIHSPLRS